MSLITAAEAAATAGTPFAWLRLAWKIAPYVAIAGLAIALLITRGTLDHVRMQARLDVGAAQLASAQHDLANANRTTAAVATYADKTAALQPLIVRSTDTVTRYAETPAGRATCAAADRVSGIDQLDASLFPAAGARAGAVPADTGTPAAGRVGDQR